MSRMSNARALDLIQNADLIELGRLATKRKRELHPKKITSRLPHFFPTNPSIKGFSKKMGHYFFRFSELLKLFYDIWSSTPLYIH